MTPLIYYMRSWFWYCSACKTKKEFCLKETCASLASSHDNESHKGKPVSSFGSQHFWHKPCGSTIHLFDFLFQQKTSYSKVLEQQNGMIKINGEIAKNNSQILYDGDVVSFGDHGCNSASLRVEVFHGVKE